MRCALCANAPYASGGPLNEAETAAVDRAGVVIVGGGIVGSAVAYFLASDPSFRGSIAIVERDPSYRDCSTARSAGGLRQQFSTPENIALSQFALETIHGLHDRFGADADVAFREQAVAARLRRDFEADLAASDEVTLTAWQRRPVLEKIVGRVCWIFERQQ